MQTWQVVVKAVRAGEGMSPQVSQSWGLVRLWQSRQVRVLLMAGEVRRPEGSAGRRCWVGSSVPQSEHAHEGPGSWLEHA